MNKLLGVSLAIAIGVAACSGEDAPTTLRPAPVQPTMTPMPVAAPAAGSGSAGDAAAKKDQTKGDKSDNEWVPAEFKTGAARWKDTGVYLDGRPVGFLTWGELPVALKPV